MQLTIESTTRSLRQSLYPFIRNQIQLIDRNRYTSDLNIIKQNKINKHLLERYHDQSYIVRDKKKTFLQKLADRIQSTSRFIYRYRYGKQPDLQTLSIDPLSSYLIFWNIWVGLSIIYHLTQIPITLFFTQAVFESQFNSWFGITSNILSLIILAINMLYVVPNTAYYYHGLLVTNQLKILKRYLGWRFAIDFSGLVVLFVYLVAGIHSLIYIKLIFYLSMYRLLRIDISIQTKIQLTKVRLAGYKLLRLILFLLFVILWLACLFFGIDHWYYQSQDSRYYPVNLWLTNSSATDNLNIIQSYPWYIWLNYAVYWCVQTVTMVGFGDLTPRNPLQVQYCSAVILLVVLLYVFFVSGVWQIVSEARQQTKFQCKQWRSFKLYQLEKINPLKDKNLTPDRKKRVRSLKNKVGSYLFEMWNQQKNYSQTNIVQILEYALTNELKNEIFINYRQNLFQSVVLFGQLAKNETKSYQYIFRDLVFRTKQQKYARNETILSNGDISNRLSYIVNGQVTLSYPFSQYNKKIVHKFKKTSQQNVLIPLNQNYNFGVKQFFTQQALPYKVVAQSFCKISELDYVDFIASMKYVQQFYIKYCQLRDQLKFYNKDYLTGETCFQCGYGDHQLKDCNQCDLMLHYRRNFLIYFNNKQDKTGFNRDKAARVPLKRRYIKSSKILAESTGIRKDVNLDKIKILPSYYPSYNLK